MNKKLIAENAIISREEVKEKGLTYICYIPNIHKDGWHVYKDKSGNSYCFVLEEDGLYRLAKVL